MKAITFFKKKDSIDLLNDLYYKGKKPLFNN